MAHRAGAALAHPSPIKPGSTTRQAVPKWHQNHGPKVAILCQIGVFCYGDVIPRSARPQPAVARFLRSRRRLEVFGHRGPTCRSSLPQSPVCARTMSGDSPFPGPSRAAGQPLEKASRGVSQKRGWWIGPLGCRSCRSQSCRQPCGSRARKGELTSRSRTRNGSRNRGRQQKEALDQQFPSVLKYEEKNTRSASMDLIRSVSDPGMGGIVGCAGSEFDSCSRRGIRSRDASPPRPQDEVGHVDWPASSKQRGFVWRRKSN
jgi:hypothetical protein